MANPALRAWQTHRSHALKRPHFAPQVECLEELTVPYAVSGNEWIRPELITISLVPDGTVIGYDGTGAAVTSTLVADFNANVGGTVAWRNEILRAAQVWAQQTNVNFAFVGELGGGEFGAGENQQGDPARGDIRIGGTSTTQTWLANAHGPAPGNTSSRSGDIVFNTSYDFGIGSGATYDLFTVASHEIGHALGLLHSTTSSTVMYASYPGFKTGLTTDDINGIRTIYNGARTNDIRDQNGNNNNFFATATVLTINATTKHNVTVGFDIGSTADTDYFRFVAPAGSPGSLRVVVKSQGISLLAPYMWVYNAAGTQLGVASGIGHYGDNLILNVSGIVSGQTYYLRVDGGDTSAFGTGRYNFSLNFSGGNDPAIPVPYTTTPIGDPPSYEGAIAEHGHGTFDHDHDEAASMTTEAVLRDFSKWTTQTYRVDVASTGSPSAHRNLGSLKGPSAASLRNFWEQYADEQESRNNQNFENWLDDHTSSDVLNLILPRGPRKR